jgi:hypothetical protein
MYDDLTQRLANLASEVEGDIALPPASAVRARGDRRRVGTAAAVAGATTLAVATGFAAASVALPGALDGDGFGVGSSATPTVTDSAPPSPTPSPGATGSGATASAAASPSAAATATGIAPTAAPDGPTIPAGLKMLHEGEAGWQRSDNPLIASAFNPCGGPDDTLAGRSDARTLTGHGNPVEEEHSPTTVSQQLFLYVEASVAATAFDAIVADATSCGWLNVAPDFYPDDADHLASLSIRAPADDQNPYGVSRGAFVVRDGNALFVMTADTGGALMSSSLSDPDVDRAIAPLCAADLVCR